MADLVIQALQLAKAAVNLAAVVIAVRKLRNESRP